MEDSGVGLEHLLGGEVARDGGASTHCHRADGGVEEPSALAPSYQGNNL